MCEVYISEIWVTVKNILAWTFFFWFCFCVLCDLDLWEIIFAKFIYLHINRSWTAAVLSVIPSKFSTENVWRIIWRLSLRLWHLDAPAWKVRPVRIVIRSSVHPLACLYVCQSLCLFMIPSHLQTVQYLKFGWWYRNQTLTSSIAFALHWHHMPFNVGQGQKEGLRRFWHILTLLPPGASFFLQQMSSCHGHQCSDVPPYPSYK